MDRFYIALIVVGFLFLLWHNGVFDKFLNEDDEDSKEKGDEGGATDKPSTGGTPLVSPSVVNVTPVAPPVVIQPVVAQPVASPSVVNVTPVASPVIIQPVGAQPVVPPKCARSAVITDPGHLSYRGWYDTENCGKKNRYCRWVGGRDVGNPARGTRHWADYSGGKWTCSTATDEYGFHPITWDASYVKSDTEEYP